MYDRHLQGVGHREKDGPVKANLVCWVLQPVHEWCAVICVLLLGQIMIYVKEKTTHKVCVPVSHYIALGLPLLHHCLPCRFHLPHPSCLLPHSSCLLCHYCPPHHCPVMGVVGWYLVHKFLFSMHYYSKETYIPGCGPNISCAMKLVCAAASLSRHWFVSNICPSTLNLLNHCHNSFTALMCFDSVMDEHTVWHTEYVDKCNIVHQGMLMW